jgi:hypothetical protein
MERSKEVMDISQMTVEEFRRLPSRKSWNEDIGPIDSLIILPADVSYLKVWLYWIWNFLSKFIALEPMEVYDIDGLHDSGYRCMDVVAVRDDTPICRLSGCSDVIHLGGIGGYGENWVKKYGKVPDGIPPVAWSLDCLPKSGLLRLFTGGDITVGPALSSFSVYSKERRRNGN